MKKKKTSGPLFFKPAKSLKTASKSAPKKAELLLAIDRLSAEGRGIGFADNKAIFVANSLPGEKVHARIVADKRDHAEAEVIEVVQASPQRIAPLCEVFGECGGCQLQMLDYAVQVAHKQQTLRHLLTPFNVAQWDEPLLASPWHYRHRARLSVMADESGAPQLGFKSANSHRVVAINNCPILDEKLQPLLQQIPLWLAQLPHWQRIDELIVVLDAQQNIALAYTAQSAFPKVERELLQQLASAAGVLIADAANTLHYAVPSQQLRWQFRTNDFTQVNPAINDQLVARCVDWLKPVADDRIADFFCGLGNFSLALAQRAGQVHGVELVEDMVARARVNAQQANIRNASFTVADLFDVNGVVPIAFNKALLDPPRAGAKVLCERLAKSRLDSILYVSCNPHTLVRDLSALTGGGYRVRRAALVDMFPQTGHIEAMVLLSRA